MLERDTLADIVGTKAPESVVFIGPVANAAADTYRARHADAVISTYEGADSLEQIQGMPRVDLAVVAHALEMMEKRRAQNLLAALRDLYSKCLVVAVRLGDNWPGLISHWQDNELLGFGMQQVARHEQDERFIGLFEFNIQDYKVSPDWLSAQHWAHPELWDIYRW
ncbi:MAG: DUF6231 family protein [Gammaproteobacteria bacterium]|nr:DUF6231 family protein [Gammaproteobacteria bacterium]